MSDKITISTFQLFKLFPDQESARLYLESRLWPNGVKCPICTSGERVTARKGGYYRCNACSEDFTVRRSEQARIEEAQSRSWCCGKIGGGRHA